MMNRSSIFKRRSSKKQQLVLSTDSSMASIFRKPQQGTKQKGLRKFFTFKSFRKDSLPSLTQTNDFTWSLSDDSESVEVMNCSNSWGHLSCNSIMNSPTNSVNSKCVVLERKRISPTEKKRRGSISPLSTFSRVAPSLRKQNFQDDLVELQATLNEFQRNEKEYRTICDEYEAFVQEQDAEIEKKESKIMQLKQMLAMKDAKHAEETQKSEQLQKSLSESQARCEEQERTILVGDIKLSKRERELQQQNRVYATLVLESQAATLKLQETIAAHEAHIKSLKAQLDAATKREGLQILQIETFNEELDAVSERYRLDSAKAEEKSQENQRRWSSMYEESI